MILEGVVTNVAAFGAFVDVGVHQDGLVHVSAMSHNYVKDPRDVVKPGDIVRVKVLDIDIPRKRISLTLRLDDDPAQSATGGPRADTAQRAEPGGSAEGARRPRGRGDGDRAGAGGQRARGDGAQRGRGDGPQRDGQRDGGQRGRGDGAQRDGQRQRDGGKRDTGQRGGGQRRAEPSGAMAEALRKAGLTGDKS
jgi:uncharacterized protein